MRFLTTASHSFSASETRSHTTTITGQKRGLTQAQRWTRAVIAGRTPSLGPAPNPWLGYFLPSAIAAHDESPFECLIAVGKVFHVFEPWCIDVKHWYGGRPGPSGGSDLHLVRDGSEASLCRLPRSALGPGLRPIAAEAARRLNLRTWQAACGPRSPHQSWQGPLGRCQFGAQSTQYHTHSGEIDSGGCGSDRHKQRRHRARVRRRTCPFLVPGSTLALTWSGLNAESA